MKDSKSEDILVSGVGITSSIGQGKVQFSEALLAGRHRFGIMARPGRQWPNSEAADGGPGRRDLSYVGAEIEGLVMPDSISASLLRTASLSSQVAVATLHEAWEDAGLADLNPERIGLIVGGSNFQQRELLGNFESYRERLGFLRPSYGLTFMDSDLCGLCTEIFGIKGGAFTVGGASASGQLAVLQAIETVLSGRLDVCIALGALMDLSCWECQAFRSLGAMGTDRYIEHPDLACRPFDKDRDGFIYGEGCGAIVVERAKLPDRRELQPYAALSGWALAGDGNRNPNPSLAGEVAVIREALNTAGLTSSEIDYINPHGTGSLVGDETELEALRRCGLSHARINATKSVVGHGLTAAGAVELVAVLLQMKEQKLHPTRNLIDPIDASFAWVGDKAESHYMKHAISLSMGFGGINTAVCVSNVH